MEKTNIGDVVEELMKNNIVVFSTDHKVLGSCIWVATTNSDYSSQKFQEKKDCDKDTLWFFELRGNCHKTVAKKDIKFIIDDEFLNILEEVNEEPKISWDVTDVMRIANDVNITLGIHEAEEILKGLELEDFTEYAGMSDDLVLNAIKQYLNDGKESSKGKN